MIFINLSYTAISMFQRCPHSYYLHTRYAKELKNAPKQPRLFVGEVLHSCLYELHITDRAKWDTLDVRQLIKRYWMHGRNNVDFTSKEQERLMALRCIDLLHMYIAVKNTPKGEEEALEEFIGIPISDDSTFWAKMDRYLVVGNKHIVIDYKTGTRIILPDSPDSRLQVDLYGWALLKKLGHFPDRLLVGYYYLQNARLYLVQYTVTDLIKTEKLVLDVYLRIKEYFETGQFPKARGMQCDYCQYARYCERD